MQILPPTLIACILCILNLLVLLWIHLTNPKETAQDVTSVEEPVQDAPQETWREAVKHSIAYGKSLQPELIGVMLLIAALLLAWIVSPGNKQEGFTFPETAGQPFYAFSYVRGFQIDILDLYPFPIIVTTSILCIALLIMARIRRKLQIARASLLLTAITCASLAQLAMSGVYQTAAPSLYLMAAAIFLFWVILARHDLKAHLLQIRWSPWMEWAMLALVLGLTIFARFYALDRVPFGIEGDESKWTVEVDQVIKLGFQVNPALDDADYHFEAIHLLDLLPALSLEAPSHNRTLIVWDKDTGSDNDLRGEILQAIRRCYPGLEEVSWIHHQLLFLSQEALEDPICFSGTLALTPREQRLDPGQNAGFSWIMNGASADTLDLSCTQERADVLAIEAETLSGPGFENISRFVTDFEGSGFLADTLDEGIATVTIADAPSETPYLWIRSYRRFHDPYPARIGVEGQMLPFALSEQIPHDQWVWERIGPLAVSPAPFDLLIERPYDPDPQVFIALFIDRIILTSSATFDPNLDPLVKPALARSFVLEPNTSQGSFELELDPGEYKCMLTAKKQNILISHLGAEGLQSNPVEIIFEPVQ